MPNPPAKSAHDLARLIFQLGSEQKINKAARLIEAYYVQRSAEAAKKRRFETAQKKLADYRAVEREADALTERQRGNIVRHDRDA